MSQCSSTRLAVLRVISKRPRPHPCEQGLVEAPACFDSSDDFSIETVFDATDSSPGGVPRPRARS